MIYSSHGRRDFMTSEDFKDGKILVILMLHHATKGITKKRKKEEEKKIQDVSQSGINNLAKHV